MKALLSVSPCLREKLPSDSHRGAKAQRGALLLFAALGLAGCHTDMWRQPKAHPLEISQELFTDGAISRPLVPGSVPRGHLREDAPYFTGIGADGKWLKNLPEGIAPKPGAETVSLLRRGQDRYRAYCTPCHGQLGDGEGMIAHRGFSLRRPVGNYHTERLRKLPIGHFYDVITNGYGAMYSYASRIEPQDRWAVAAYVRALQLSQNAPAADFDEAAFQAQEAKKAEEKAKEEAPAAEGGHE